MTRVPVNPDLIRWACDRPGVDPDALARRFPKLARWQAGDVQPTLRQLEDFAKATRAPFGYFFLPEPPVERVPIPDFRTVGNAFIDRPSPDLLDTIYTCQQRQDWYREYARTNHEPPLPFVGSVKRPAGITAAADRIRSALGFSVEQRRQFSTWTHALRHFIEQAEHRLARMSSPFEPITPTQEVSNVRTHHKIPSNGVRSCGSSCRYGHDTDRRYCGEGSNGQP